MRKFLLVLLLSVSCFAQSTHKIPATDTNNTWSGSNTFSGTVNVPSPAGASSPAQDGSVVHLSGNEMIAGNKTFSGVTSASNLNGVRNASKFASIQAALDDAGVGGSVYIPSGVYPITTALHPYMGQFIECAAGDVAAGNGAIIKPSGAIWALQNPTPTTANLGSLLIANCTFDLTGSSVVGGLNLRASSFGTYVKLKFLLPATGSIEAIRFDAQDYAGAGGGSFWNDFFAPSIYALGAGGDANSHIGFRWINASNDNHIYGGQVLALAKPFRLESAENNSVYGTGAETFGASGAIYFGATALRNTFINTRMESFATGAVAVKFDTGSSQNRVINGYPNGIVDAAHVLVDNASSANEYRLYNAAGTDINELETALHMGGGSGFRLGSQLNSTLASGATPYQYTVNGKNWQIGSNAGAGCNDDAYCFYSSTYGGGHGSRPIVIFAGSSGQSTFDGIVEADGGLKGGASGSTISDTRELVQSAHSCGTTATCSNTSNGSYRMIFGSVTLSGGTATVTGISPAFASTSSFICTTTDVATTPAASSVQNTSTSSITVKGGTTATINYHCIGN